MMIWPLIALALIPVITGSLPIVQRQLREVSEYTIGTFIAYSMVLGFGGFILFQKEERGKFAGLL